MKHLSSDVAVEHRPCAGADEQLRGAHRKTLRGGRAELRRRERAPLHVAQQPRRPQDLAEDVGAGVRKAEVRSGAVEEQSKQQLLFVAAVADLAQAEHAAVGVGEQRIFVAALREHIVLHPHDEQMLERASAELHHVAEPDVRLRCIRVGERGRFDRVDGRGGIERPVPNRGAPEEIRDLVDALRRREIELRFETKHAGQSREDAGVERGGELFHLGDERDVVVDRGRVPPPRRAQLLGRAAGDARASCFFVDAVDVQPRPDPQSIAHELEHFAAREAALAQPFADDGQQGVARLAEVPRVA